MTTSTETKCNLYHLQNEMHPCVGPMSIYHLVDSHGTTHIVLDYEAR